MRPLERGGEVARIGFGFQDHVAAHYLLRMLTDPKLKEVWCEHHDDITLVWDENGHDHFEFVQVKASDIHQHWSVAELCKRDKRKEGTKTLRVPGTSILEKSLANDRGAEPCRFQMVTICRTDEKLAPLTLPLTSPDRSFDEGKLTKLIAATKEYVDGYISDNDHDVVFWLCNTYWLTWADERHVQMENIELLEKYCETLEEFPAIDHKHTLYSKVLEKAKGAGEARYARGPEHKRITKDAFTAWMVETIDDVLHPAAKGKGTKLREKMEGAKIPSPQIANADALRRHYNAHRHDSAYLDLRLGREAEMEALGEFQRLLNLLESDSPPATGSQFLGLCLQRMDAVSERLKNKGSVSPAYLEGFMYETTDRCAFQFGSTAI